MTKREKFLPYGRQNLDEEDIQAVVDALRSDFLTTGPLIEQFEDRLKTITGSEYAIAVANGTAALHMACLAAEIGTGDLVIVPSISFVSTANAAMFCGADVIFCDVDPDNGLMRLEDVESLLSGLDQNQQNKIKAILPVNLAGQVCELEAIHNLARQKGWAVILDSCHALGTTYQDLSGQQCSIGDCTYADMECFSFHPVKNIAMGEGGAISTNDPTLDDKLRFLRAHGITRNPDQLRDDLGPDRPWYYEMQSLGFNYRQSDIHCALGLNQLAKMDQFKARRLELTARYDEKLASFSPLIKPLKRRENVEACWHLYVALLDFDQIGLSRAEVMKKLTAQNIGSQVHYIPIHQQPFYIDRYGALDLPGAEVYYARCLSLPLHTNMTDQDADDVVACLGEILS